MRNLKSDKLYVQVFNEIRRYIIKNNLKPNDKLPTELEMCEMLGTSRNIVREAVKALELMGMVKSIPGVGCVIQEFSMDSIFQHLFYFLVADDDERIYEILDIRKALELYYMEQAFHSLTGDDIKELRRIMERIKEKWAKKEYFHDEDRQFHLLLYKNINNRTLIGLFEAAWQVDAMFKTEEKLKHLDGTIVKHEKIVEALEEGDYEKFKKWMTAHFNSGKYEHNNSFNEY